MARKLAAQEQIESMREMDRATAESQERVSNFAEKSSFHMHGLKSAIGAAMLATSAEAEE